MQPKSSVVLVHGEWTDGSSWNKVIPLLQRNGLRVTAVQIPLTSLADDVAVLRHVIGLQGNPIVLAGHSYGGSVITEAGTNAPNVVGLVYVSAFAPDEGESLGDLYARAAAPGLAHLRPDDEGFLWIDPDGFAEAVAQDVDPVQARTLAVVQKPIAARVFSDKTTQPAWELKPSWYLVSESDQMIPAVTQRFMSKRIGAKVTSVQASHFSMVSRPVEVAKLISEAAANAGVSNAEDLRLAPSKRRA
ncbi:MAG: alpha/beta hydrolase [Candidatus Binatia bacterium]